MNSINGSTQAYSVAAPQPPALSKELTAALIGLSQQKSATQVATDGLNAATAEVGQAIGTMVDVRV